MRRALPSFSADHPTLVLQASRDCKTIHIAVRSLRSISPEVDGTLSNQLILEGRTRISAGLLGVATTVHQAMQIPPVRFDSAEPLRTLMLRSTACMDQLIAAQQGLNYELARFLGNSVI